jgi:hypothetical protein
MQLDGARGDPQPLGDPLVGRARHQQPEHLQLPAAEPVQVRGRATRTTATANRCTSAGAASTVTRTWVSKPSASGSGGEERGAGSTRHRCADWWDDVWPVLHRIGRGRLRVFEVAEDLQWEQRRLSHHLVRMQRRGLVAREESAPRTGGAPSSC